MEKTTSQRAIEAAGGQRLLAKEFSISPSAVHQWGLKDKIPAQHVIQVCRMTGCLFQPNMLRPDIFDESQTIEA